MAPGVICVRASYVSLSHRPYPTFSALRNSLSFPVPGCCGNDTNSLTMASSWLYPKGQKCCLSLIRSTQNQRHSVFMRVFRGLNHSLPSCLICLCHHWPTFFCCCSVVCLALPCDCNEALTPSGFLRHLRGNSPQCVAESPGCWFLLCAQSCRNGNPERPICRSDG